MVSETDDNARAALRERQGSGARYDSENAPKQELAWARLGTANFARLLNDLRDDQLDAPARVTGWTRRHVVAQVSYHARALSRLVEGARTGEPIPMYVSDEERIAEINSGATLPARALRYLFQHTEVHLNVEWRDLSEEGWDVKTRLHDGNLITIRDTAWIRAREIWLSSLDLDCGVSFDNLPQDFVDRL